MKKYERIITIIMLAVISLSNVATPVSYAAELAVSKLPIPGTKPSSEQFGARPKFAVDSGSVLGASTSLLTVGSQSLDLRQDTAYSAHKRIPIQVQQLSKKVFRTDEDVTLAVTNPDNEVFNTAVQDATGQNVNVPITESNNGMTTTIDLAPSDTIKPGKYKVVVTDQNGVNTEQDFSWGVLALNTDKTLYHPGEKAGIAMAVLNDQGDMVCDAKLYLEITNTALGIKDVLSTEAKDSTKITVNPQCQVHDFSLIPDYEAQYTFGKAGTYQLQLTSVTKNGRHMISDTIQVQDEIAFDLQRVSATRIYPPNTYPMLFNITANRDFNGTVTETVPDSFTITPATQSAAQSYNAMQTVYLNSNDPAALMSQQIASGSGGLVMPFHGTYPITQGFGAQLTDPTLQAFYSHYGLGGHDGIDFGLPMNTPLYAVDEGDIIWSGPGDYGTMVSIHHSWGQTYYGHMSNTSVTVGQHVTKGQLIGYSGMSGEATGPHLHFGMKPTSPDMTNGYYGKIDPMPFLPIGQGEPITALGGAANPIATAVYNTTVLGASDSATSPTPSTAPSTSPEVSPSAQPTAAPTTTPTAAPVASEAAQQVTVTPTPTTAPSVFSQPTTNVHANTNFSVLDKEIKINEEIANNALTDKVKILTWNVHLKKGEKTTLGYAYKAPHVSPQFYLLGPAKFYSGGNDRVVFQEQRQWQIASDDVGVEWYQNTTGSNFNGYSWQYRKKLTIDHTKVNAGAVAYDATGPTTTPNESATSPLAWTHTVSGSDTALLVGVAVGGTDTGMTISATDNSSKNMVLLRMVHSDEVDGATSGFIAVFGLINPPSGSNSISVAVSGGTLNSMTGASESFTGVSGFGQAVGNSGDTTLTGANGTVTLNNTTSGNIIAGFICNGSAINNAIAPSTDRYVDNDTSSNGCGTFGASSTNATGSSQTVSWKMGTDFWGAIAVEVLAKGTALPTTTFMDSGGDATNGTTGDTNITTSTKGFYSATSGTVAFDTGTKETGLGSLKFTTGASGAVASTSATTVLDDGGRRVSAYYNFTNLPAATDSIMSFQTSGNTQMFAVRVTSAGALELDAGKVTTMSSIGTGAGFTFSTGTWYRISVGYTVTNATTYTIDVYVNGTLSLSATNSTSLGTTGTSGLFLGWVSPNAGNSKVLYMDDVYIDTGNDNSDTGDIHVTAKRPNANGASNQFNTSGTPGVPSGSFLGNGTSNHWSWVSERAVNASAFLTVGASTTLATVKSENFTVEGASSGDTDISTYSPVANQSWVYAREEQSGCTAPYYYFNGDKVLMSLTTSAAMYSSIQNNTYYPSGSSAVGTTNCFNATGTHVIDQYETGIQIAYTTASLTATASSLSNFPVLVSLSGDTGLSTYAQSSCNDVVFTDSTGRTKLNYELDNITSNPTDCSSGNINAWVNISTLSANTDTILYMYYGNPSASNQENASGTWNSNYKGVWHMGEAASGTATVNTDSTSNSNNGTLTGSAPAPTYVAGELGNSVQFGATNNISNAGSGASLDNLSSSLTAEAWVKLTSVSGFTNRFIVGKTDSSGFADGWQFIYEADTGAPELDVSFGGTGSTDIVKFSTNNVMPLNTWVHLVATWDGSLSASSGVHIYVNGAEILCTVGSTGNGTFVSDAADNLTMGQWPDLPTGGNLVGDLDEVRVSNTVRSAGWVQTEYNDESSPSTFIPTVGGQETSIDAPTLSELMGHGEWFDSTGTKQPFVF